MDATDPKMQKANKGSLLNDNSHTKIESPNKSAITFDDDENEDRKNNVHVDGNVDQEKQAKIFKDKINTLSKNSKVDENINEVIQNKINNGGQPCLLTPADVVSGCGRAGVGHRPCGDGEWRHLGRRVEPKIGRGGMGLCGTIVAACAGRIHPLGRGLRVGSGGADLDPSR